MASTKKTAKTDLVGSIDEAPSASKYVDPLQRMLDDVTADIEETEEKIKEFEPTFAVLADLQRKRKEITGMIEKLSGTAKEIVRSPRGQNLATISDLLSDGKARTLTEIQKETGINGGSVRAVLVQNPLTFTKDEDSKRYSIIAKSRKAA